MKTTTEPVQTTIEVTDPPETSEAATTTEAPTTTASPTTTPAPVAPLVFDGSGNDVVDLGATFTDARLFVATFGGDGYTGVVTLGEDLTEGQRLVNAIAPSTGNYVLNLRDDESARYLKVEADAEWHLEIRALTEARPWDSTPEITGVGNDVLLYRSDGGIMDYGTTHDGYFGVSFYGDSTETLVNEVGPIEGTTAIPGGVALVVVESDGDWRMTIRP